MEVTHEMYLALNEMHQARTMHQSEIECFDLLKKHGLIQRCKPIWAFEVGESEYWVLSSVGRLELNIYEKQRRPND